jgi:hypothetical protein
MRERKKMVRLRQRGVPVAPIAGFGPMVLVLLSLGACGTDDQQQTAIGGAAVGAAAGCGVGAVVSGEGGTGCAVGGVLGGAAGLAAGSQVAERKRGYADREEMLDAEIDDAERLNDDLAGRNASLRDEVRERRRRAEVLEAALASGRASSEDRDEELEEVRARVEAAEETLARARDELEAKQALLEDARDEGEQGEVDDYADEVAEMRRHVDELSELVARYRDVGERVEDT